MLEISVSEKKLHQVGWNVACKEKTNGGLGIKGTFNINKALPGK